MFKYFLGDSPKWFKTAIVSFLIFNVFSFYVLGPYITSWLIIGEFIFTLSMALKCYPLQSGGLLAIEAIALQLTTPERVYEEVIHNMEVVLLLVFMVAAIHFMKPLLMYIFSKILLKIRAKITLSLLLVFLSAVLSAFLDALTVTAVLISVAVGFFQVYKKVFSVKDNLASTDKEQEKSLEKFKSYSRSLMMHSVVGTALGGVCTLVGEPQNLLIGEKMNWDFITFFIKMAPVTLPVLAAGLVTTFLLEKTRIFGFGERLPDEISNVIKDYIRKEDENRSSKEKFGLIVQGISAVLLIISLALHIAPVGFIGLALIIIQTAFMGITEEHKLGESFEEGLPFTGLIIVFFAIVAMIHDQHLFKPIINWALTLDPSQQPAVFYLANGILSMISDNVFVATVYIGEVQQAFELGTISAEQYEKLAIAINTGTNLPSVATPNGQAAFLFLLTSSLAPLLGLSYVKMIKMALPYTIVLLVMGLIGVIYFL